MRRLIAILIAGLALATPAAAGAWLRDEGDGFVSLSGTMRAGPADAAGTKSFETGLHGDFGAFRRLTLGLDVDETPGESGHALVFARLPLGPIRGRRRMALELGLGAHHVGGQWAGMGKATLSWGLGFAGPGGGWLAIDGALERRAATTTTTARTIYKIDAGLGLPSRRRIRPMLKIETSQVEGAGFYWSVIPSLIIPDRDGRRWVVGLEARSGNPRTLGLKLSLWKRF